MTFYFDFNESPTASSNPAGVFSLNTFHYINLEPDTRDETKRLFDALSEEGKVTMPLQEMFWGAYYGTCVDKFGVQWMFNCTGK